MDSDFELSNTIVTLAGLTKNKKHHDMLAEIASKGIDSDHDLRRVEKALKRFLGD